MTISHTLQAAADTAISFLSLCDKKRESLETVWRRVSTRSFCVYVEAAAPPVEQLGEDKEALLIFLGFVRPIALLPQILNFFAKWFSSRPLPRWSLQQQPLYERRPTSNDDGA